MMNSTNPGYTTNIPSTYLFNETIVWIQITVNYVRTVQILHPSSYITGHLNSATPGKIGNILYVILISELRVSESQGI